MIWWCSARDVAWTWSWQAYPGVWLLVAALASAYLWAIAQLDPDQAATQRQRRFFFLGLVAIWVAADWPVGALGAGYLLSVHQAQFVLFAMVGPPFMILGTPPAVWRRALTAPLIGRLAQFATRPLLLLCIFNVFVIASHLPAVVDGLMTSQLGSFALDLAWIAAGFALWWPVISPVPEINGLSYPGRFAFLIASVLLPAAPPLFLIFADYPLYALYELAPPIGGISAAADQLVGGLIMKLGSTVAVITGATIIFFRWHAAECGDEGSVVYRDQLPGYE
jgi:putative membrane protein